MCNCVKLPNSIHAMLAAAPVRSHRLSMNEDQMRMIIDSLRASKIETPFSVDTHDFPPTTNEQLAQMLEEVVNTPRDEWQFNMLHGLTI